MRIVQFVTNAITTYNECTDEKSVCDAGSTLTVNTKLCRECIYDSDCQIDSSAIIRHIKVKRSVERNSFSPVI